jgi:hypothetical protein
MPLTGDRGSVRVVVGSVLVDPTTGHASRLGWMGDLQPVDPDARPELHPSGQMCAYDRFSGQFMPHRIRGIARASDAAARTRRLATHSPRRLDHRLATCVALHAQPRHHIATEAASSRRLRLNRWTNAGAPLLFGPIPVCVNET